MDSFKLRFKIEIIIFNMSAIISNVDVIKTVSEETKKEQLKTMVLYKFSEHW